MPTPLAQAQASSDCDDAPARIARAAALGERAPADSNPRDSDGMGGAQQAGAARGRA